MGPLKICGGDVLITAQMSGGFIQSSNGSKSGLQECEWGSDDWDLSVFFPGRVIPRPSAMVLVTCSECRMQGVNPRLPTMYLCSAECCWLIWLSVFTLTSGKRLLNPVE